MSRAVLLLKDLGEPSGLTPNVWVAGTPWLRAGSGTSVPVSTRPSPWTSPYIIKSPFSGTGTSRTGFRAHTQSQLMTSVKTQGHTQVPEVKRRTGIWRETI